ncbi:hypothetical protein D3C85_896210 [compost metagenome]
MGRGFVQQQDRLGLLPGQPPDLGQDQVQHQSLLLARRPLGGGPVLLAVQGGQVRTMRPEQRTPRRRITPPRPHKALAQHAHDVGFVRPRRRHRLGLAGQAQVGLGKGPVSARVDARLKRRQGPRPRRRRPRPGLGQPRLQRIQPQGVGGLAFRPVGQQPQPLPQRLFIGRNRRRMVGVSRKHQPVKEPQPRRPRVGKQPVLFGRGPDRAQMVQQPPRRGRFAVDADDAPCSPRRLHPGAQTHLFALFIQRDHDGPGPPQGLARLAPPHLLRRRPAQALTGRQQTDGLQQIGLARPVRPMQHHGPAGNRQAGARIGTEVGEGEGGDHKRVT